MQRRYKLLENIMQKYKKKHKKTPFLKKIQVFLKKLAKMF